MGLAGALGCRLDTCVFCLILQLLLALLPSTSSSHGQLPARPTATQRDPPSALGPQAPLLEPGSRPMGEDSGRERPPGYPVTLTRCPRPCYCSVSRPGQLRTWRRSCQSHSVETGRGRLVLGLGGAARATLFCCRAQEALSCVLCTPQSHALLSAQPSGRKESGAGESQGRGCNRRRR